mmetsp:Transcript_24153/g.57406  ORF Transcript_24153/g.57406 Transcript_24153/m.57406 type:complete len:267 (-) Transcript_24153:570-1370(-)
MKSSWESALPVCSSSIMKSTRGEGSPICPSSPLKNSSTSAKLPVKASSIMANLLLAETALYSGVLIVFSRWTASAMMGPTRWRKPSHMSTTWTLESLLASSRMSLWSTPSRRTNFSISCANASRMPRLVNHSFSRACTAKSFGSIASRIFWKSMMVMFLGSIFWLGGWMALRRSRVSRQSASDTSRCPTKRATARRSSLSPIVPLLSVSSSLNMAPSGSASSGCEGSAMPGDEPVSEAVSGPKSAGDSAMPKFPPLLLTACDCARA